MLWEELNLWKGDRGGRNKSWKNLNSKRKFITYFWKKTHVSMTLRNIKVLIILNNSIM